MNNNLEFVRGNQKNFIRLSIEDEVLCTYQFQMFTHNVIKSFLPFQKRAENAQLYLYYDISGTQSLDVLVQIQKLKREFFLLFAKELLRLCKDISEYMLSLDNVVLDIKYMMYKADEQAIQFVYAFKETHQTNDGFNDLLEYCVEYLDYSDRLLSDCVFQLYEHLQDQGENFSLEYELENVIRILDEAEQGMKESQEESVVQPIEPFEVVIPEETPKYKEVIFEKADKKGKRGILLLLCAEVIGIIAWKPLTILKICFYFSFGISLLALYVYISRKQKADEEKRKEEKRLQEITYRNEYESIAAQCNEEDGTQFLAIGYMSGILYNLQGIFPQYIHITENLQLIGKDKESVQICILAEGISRVHASIVKKGEEYLLEDLCSTNGTWVNGKNIGARVPHVLKEGDYIRFASAEYIFR